MGGEGDDRTPVGQSGPYDFQDQLKVGQKGENLLVNVTHGAIAPLDGRTNDLKIVKTSLTIELKTDTFNMERTPNFFIERFSTDTGFEAGGPWQALEKGSDLFIYMFVVQGECFVFKTKELVEALEPMIRNMKLTPVRNRAYNTLGYKIKRDTLVPAIQFNVYKTRPEDIVEALHTL